MRPFVKAFAFGGLGAVLLVGGTVALALGAVALVVAATVAFRAVWRWERTHVVVTTEKLAIVRRTTRQRAAAVPLQREWLPGSVLVSHLSPGVGGAP